MRPFTYDSLAKEGQGHQQRDYREECRFISEPSSSTFWPLLIDNKKSDVLALNTAFELKGGGRAQEVDTLVLSVSTSWLTNPKKIP